MAVTKDHGVVDSKGRKLGHEGWIRERTNATPLVQWSGYLNLAGERVYPCGDRRLDNNYGAAVAALPTYFEVSVHATRDGERFGAVHPGTACATREIAEQVLAAKLAKAKPGKL